MSINILGSFQNHSLKYVWSESLFFDDKLVFHGCQLGFFSLVFFTEVVVELKLLGFELDDIVYLLLGFSVNITFHLVDFVLTLKLLSFLSELNFHFLFSEFFDVLGFSFLFFNLQGFFVNFSIFLLNQKFLVICEDSICSLSLIYHRGESIVSNQGFLFNHILSLC